MEEIIKPDQVSFFMHSHKIFYYGNVPVLFIQECTMRPSRDTIKLFAYTLFTPRSFLFKAGFGFWSARRFCRCSGSKSRRRYIKWRLMFWGKLKERPNICLRNVSAILKYCRCFKGWRIGDMDSWTYGRHHDLYWLWYFSRETWLLSKCFIKTVWGYVEALRDNM